MYIYKVWIKEKEKTNYNLDANKFEVLKTFYLYKVNFRHYTVAVWFWLKGKGKDKRQSL